MHRSWIYRLLARYRAEVEAAYQPRSRRAHTIGNAIEPAVIELALKLRIELERQGLDAGARTICWHPREHHGITIAPVTIWRSLTKPCT